MLKEQKKKEIALLMKCECSFQIRPKKKLLAKKLQTGSVLADEDVIRTLANKDIFSGHQQVAEQRLL